MKVAIIPARGGSKRIAHKNIKNFCGKPLILYSLAAAKASGIFDKILVSTEDEQIKQICTDNEVEVLDRPAQLADDKTGTAPVIRHAIQSLGLDASAQVCCIYATAPLLSKDEILQAQQMLEANLEKMIFTAVAYSFPPQRAFMLDKSGLAFYLAPEHRQSRSQDLDKVYHDAGQLYFATAKSWMKKQVFEMPLILPEMQVQDIDTISDWEIAELKYKYLQEKQQNQQQETTTDAEK